MSNGVSAWSYSAWAQYELCPFQYYCQRIKRLPTSGSPAMERGNKIHKIAEVFLSGKTEVTEDDVPPELATFDTLFAFARNEAIRGNLVIQCEENWGFDRNWRTTGYFTKQGPKKTWLRSKTDAYWFNDAHGTDMTIVDHKTGKLYKTNEDQVELFAACGMFRFPSVNKVEARLWYLDSGDEVVREYTRDQLPDIKAKFEKKVAPMFVDDVWAPRPNDKCKWCDFSRSKGGPCKFG